MFYQLTLSRENILISFTLLFKGDQTLLTWDDFWHVTQCIR